MKFWNSLRRVEYISDNSWETFN